MNADHLVSWLIHSDWYFVGGWLLLLGIAVLLSFTKLAPNLLRCDRVKSDEIPPIP